MSRSMFVGKRLPGSLCTWGIVGAGIALAWVLSNASVGESIDAPAAVATDLNAADFPSLQAALDALPATGGRVLIPAGEYRITQPLLIAKSDVTLEGVGGASHIVNTNTSGEPAVLIASTAEKPAGGKRPEALWRVRVANLRITGGDGSGSGIEARNVNEIFVQGVTVSENGRHGIHLDQCYEDPRINDCLITYNKQTGLHLDGCHDIVVNGNHFEENQDGVRCIDSYNLCMNGNNLDDHLGDGVVIENTYGSVLSGNMIEECQGWAIVLDRDCYGITLSANVIAHEFSGGMDLRDAHGCAVSANTFTLVKKHAIAVRRSSGRITITGNNFCDSYIGAATKRTQKNTKLEEDQNEATGILLEDAPDLSIVGNTFSSLAGPAITGDAEGKHWLIAHNLFADVTPGIAGTGGVTSSGR